MVAPSSPRPIRHGSIELALYLKNIPFACDLFVSVSTDEARDICYQAFSRLPQASRIIVDVVENRDRDMTSMVCYFGARPHTRRELNAITHRLNTRPKKCLHFATPLEVYAHLRHHSPVALGA
jgi:lipopolysaccharide biosynthesis protein